MKITLHTWGDTSPGLPYAQHCESPGENDGRRYIMHYSWFDKILQPPYSKWFIVVGNKLYHWVITPNILGIVSFTENSKSKFLEIFLLKFE